ncbi:calcineurin-like phosphoesterase family protein [Algoriphagus sp. NG3]|uniref:calcineurin-like phosphoesterase family protein n=1 Tax=Algoriphagus sp. NG3 TaxID=3097546 RepID=UPI002A841348|nr:calcineurin-like phosphoesterase family protein [Algoriphagus sp. NG3]WPR73789.1 calcineurin-like phosphoesterase family protein [Algoriphagus sp. NG3]
MKKILHTGLTAALIFTSFTAFSQELAKGYVYHDANGDGKKQRREMGLPAVSVSNGQEVVQTDEKGYYEIGLKDGQLLFVIKPSGFTVALDSLNKPQFYYIHKPSGSPELKYAGSAPTGALPKEINFAMTATEEADDFTALIFGDPQPYTLEEVDFFDRGIVSEVVGIRDVAFGLSLGDLVGDDLDLFTPYAKAVAKVGLPWYNVMGNHDQNYDVDKDEWADETFEAHFGPSAYAYNVGKVHFIVLDDILWPDPRDQQGYWGGMRPDQLDFLRNDLKYVPKDHLIVIAMHIPLAEEGDSFRDEDRQEIFDLLEDFPYTLSLSAHTHLQKQDYFFREDGWKQDKPHHHYNVGTTSGDWYKGTLDENGVPVSTMRDGTPKGYALIDFEGNQYKIRYQVAGKSSDYQMEIFAPKVLEKDKRTTAGIFVNFFMGGEGDEVLIRFDEGEWKAMGKVEDYDPSYLVDLFEWDVTEELIEGRRPSNPAQSKHLWRGAIPAKLKAGEHVVRIQATDRFGQVHSGEAKFKVVEKK